MSKIIKTFLVVLLPVFLFSFTMDAESRGKWAEPDGTYFFIKSAKPAYYSNEGYWDQAGKPRRYKKGTDLKLWAKDGEFNNDQKFRAFRKSNGWYRIKSLNGGYVDVSGAKNANGVKIQVWDRNNSPAQEFRFKYLGAGKWKIYTRWGRIIAAKGKHSKNGTALHTWHDHSDRSNEWYFVDAYKNTRIFAKKNSSNSSSSSSSSKTKVSLDSALSSKDSMIKKRYFGEVSISQFGQDKASSKIPSYYSKLENCSSQWNHVNYTIEGTRYNKDPRVRLYVYRALTRIKYKNPNFVEKALAPKMREKLNKVARAEKHPTAKKYLENAIKMIK